MATMTKAEKVASAQYAETKLREWLTPGTRIATVQTHRTAGGTRSVKFLLPLGGEIVDISYFIHAYQDYRMDPDYSGLKCDDPHAVIYHLAWKLFGDGSKLSSYNP